MNKARLRQESEDERFYELRPEVLGSLRRISFRSLDSAVVVTFRDAVPTTMSLVSDSDGAPFLDLVKTSPQTGAAIYSIPDTQGDDPLTKLATDARVLNFLPALLDAEGNARHFMPDEVDVQFVAGIEEERIDAILAMHGLFSLARYRTPGFLRVGFGSEAKLFKTIRALNSHRDVLFAEPVEIGIDDYASFTPSATAFHLQWGLKNEGQDVAGVMGNAGVDIRATEAWQFSRGSARTVVAVIDTGADIEHPNLVEGLLPGNPADWNFSGDGGEPSDTNGHGTHVCGIAVARDLGETIGVANLSYLLPLKVDLSSGVMASRADAINYVAKLARESEPNYIINCSWKMAGDVASVRLAFSKAVEAGVLVVVAAGNQGKDLDIEPRYPACYPDICVVSSIDNRGAKAPSSNWGSKVDICAPGVNIYSTYPGNRYFYLSGTSQAAPHVAGASALLWSVNPDLTPVGVLQRLKSTARPIAYENPGFKLGAGLIDVGAAIRTANI